MWGNNKQPLWHLILLWYRNSCLSNVDACHVLFGKNIEIVRSTSSIAMGIVETHQTHFNVCLLSAEHVIFFQPSDRFQIRVGNCGRSKYCRKDFRHILMSVFIFKASAGLPPCLRVKVTKMLVWVIFSSRPTISKSGLEIVEGQTTEEILVGRLQTHSNIGVFVFRASAVPLTLGVISDYVVKGDIRPGVSWIGVYISFPHFLLNQSLIEHKF